MSARFEISAGPLISTHLLQSNVRSAHTPEFIQDEPVKANIKEKKNEINNAHALYVLLMWDYDRQLHRTSFSSFLTLHISLLLSFARSVSLSLSVPLADFQKVKDEMGRKKEHKQNNALKIGYFFLLCCSFSSIYIPFSWDFTSMLFFFLCLVAFIPSFSNPVCVLSSLCHENASAQVFNV